MKRMTVAATLLVASCSTAAPGPPSSPLACPIIGSSGWAASVQTGASQTLVVTGRVTVPTGGYRFAWRDMRVAESYPVQVFAELDAIPPSGGAVKAVMTHDIRGEWPIDPPVGSFTVRCGDMVLARVSPVETAQ